MRKALFICLLLSVFSLTGCNDRLDGDGVGGSTLNGQLVQILSAHYTNPDSLFIGSSSSPESNPDLVQFMKSTLMPLFGNPAKEQIEKLDKIFEEKVGLTPDGHRQWRLESYEFTYRTKSARGEDIVLSGVVAFPNNTVEGVDHAVKFLDLSSHAAATASSRALMGESYYQRALFNSAFIMPDFQGYGNTLGKETYCFMSSEVLARQLADCALAALDVMHLCGVSLAPYGYTFNQGTSQGAVIPVAFAKWYETKAPQSFKDQIRLRATLASNGPCDFASLMWYLSSHPEFDATLSNRIVVSLLALSPEQLGGYSALDFLSDASRNTIVTVDGVPMPYYEAVGKYEYNVWGAEKDAPSIRSMADILAPDMLTSQGKLNSESPKTQAFFRILSEQNPVYDWSPSLPIYFVHCPQDNAIPYEVAHDYYDVLSGRGSNGNVHFGNLRLPPLSGAVLGRVPFATHLVASLIIGMRELESEIVEDLTDDWEN